MKLKITVRHFCLLLMGVVISARVCPASPENKTLFFIHFGEADPSIRGEVWDRFWIGGKEVTVVAAPAEIADGRGPSAPGEAYFDEAYFDEAYFIVTAYRGVEPELLGRHGTVLLHDARVALIRTDQASAEKLAALGMEIKRVMRPPGRALPPAGDFGVRLSPPQAGIQRIMDQVNQASVSELLGNLSGDNSVTIGGSPYTIRTRNSYQATPIEKATRYCHERLQGSGLTVSYDNYTWYGYDWRNVVAEQAGTVNPENIVIVCAHLDDEPGGSIAPGSDDNASGSVAVLTAASILSRHEFENTIYYLLFTGEEQGLIGSYNYVRDLAAGGANVLGVLNFDMIAYDSNSDGVMEVHCGQLPASEVLGDLLIDTVNRYTLPLAAEKITTGSVTSSDHSRFWDAGYPAVLGIEDTWSDFTPFYHTTDDTPANCNISYLTSYVKAAVGTTARLGVLRSTPPPIRPVIESGDYDGDGTGDIGVFRPASGLWAVREITRCYFGGSSDLPVPGDYGGDGTTEIAFFRPGSGLWVVRGLSRYYFGGAGDAPAPGDYNGDGTAGAAVFRGATGLWAVRNLTRLYFGGAGDMAVPADFEGDGADDIGIFRGSAGLWAVQGVSRAYFGRPTGRPVPGVYGGGGAPSDLPVPADYDGDGTAEFAVFRPDTGFWAVRDVTRCYFGGAGDVAVPADYDGDGTAEFATFRESPALWTVRSLTRAYFGASGDIPLAR